MRPFVSFLFVVSTSALAITGRQNGNNVLQRGDTTLVLKEVGGVPGNECLTFRNNGALMSISRALRSQVTDA
jgi:hypothetical protein